MTRLKKQIINNIEMHLKNLESSDSCKAYTPEEPTDFYSELNKDVSSFRQHNSELTRYLEAKPTSLLSILNSYPNIKTLLKNSILVLHLPPLLKDFFLWVVVF